MTESRPLPELIEYRYGDRGGWTGLTQLFTAKIPYEMKMASVKEKYRVSTDTAKNWYGAWRKMYNPKREEAVENDKL